MATLKDSYYVPSDIRWVEASRNINSGAINKDTKAMVGEGGISKKLCWVCSHSNFQYQYRIRRRYSPPYASAMGLSSDGEVWEEWGEWQGADLSEDTRSAAERMNHISNTTITDDAFSFAYDFSQFDKMEYQVRVRTFNPFTFECSEWGYETLEVVYQPTAAFASAVRQADGSVLLTVDTNWLRGGNRFYMKNVQQDSKSATVIKKAVSESGLEPDYTVTIPYSLTGKAERIYATFWLYTSDGVTADLPADYFDITKGGGKPETIDPPVVSVEDSNAASIVSVTSSGGAYTAVYVSASYIDALGNESLIEVEATEADGVWIAEIEAPPYDLPVVYRVSVANSDGWEYVETEHVTASKGRFTWSNGEMSVSLVFDQNTSSEFKPNTEVVDLTNGTSIARFGRGGSRALSASGALLAPSIADGAWRPALEALRQPKAWVYRKPGGERYKVVVTSVSESEEKGTIDRVVSASISMREVL